MMITQERLKQVAQYNPLTGRFHWLERGKGRIIGRPAGGNMRGYVSIGIDGEPYKAHILAWLYMTGEYPDFQIDHKNRIRNDNRWGNLRQATGSQNQMNTGVRSDNTSGCTGVIDWGNGKWRAVISAGGCAKHLGMFDTFEEAVSARKAAELEYFGEFAPVEV